MSLTPNYKSCLVLIYRSKNYFKSFLLLIECCWDKVQSAPCFVGTESRAAVKKEKLPIMLSYFSIWMGSKPILLDSSVLFTNNSV